LLRFAEANPIADTAGVEDGHGGTGGDAEVLSGACEEAGESAGLYAQQASKRNLRKVFGPGCADVGISRNELLFRLADIGAALQQGRGKAWRNGGRREEIGNCFTARDGAGDFRGQKAQQIFELFDLALGGGDLGSGSVEKLFSLANIERGGYSALTADLGEFQTALRNSDGTAADGEFIVSFAKEQVIVGDVAHQRGNNGAAAFFGGQILGAGGFGEAAQAAPYVQFPGEIEAGGSVIDIEVGATGN